MTKTPWTPGPWRWWTSNSWKRLSANGDGDVICPTVARSDGHPDLIVKAPDMRLIAAAPEMAETNDLLIGLCQWILHRFGPNSPEGKEATFRLQRANDVRAKARGEE